MKNTTYKDKFDRKLDRLFLWKCEDKEFKFPKRMELLLHEKGSIGYDLIHKQWVIGNFDGIVDDNNDFVNYVCFTLSSYPESYTLKNHEEVVVCGNNTMYSADIEEQVWYSNMLEDTDISIYYQLINSRNIPMLSVSNDHQKKEIELSFSKMKAGVPVCITSDLMSEVKTLDIIDTNNVDKLSTLDTFRDELLKRWCSSYGITIDTKEKKAQVNEMELDSFGDFDTLNFLEMFESRLDFCNEMKENGINIECINNPIFWEEPTEEDIENGDYEEMEVNENESSENQADTESEEQQSVISDQQSNE